MAIIEKQFDKNKLVEMLKIKQAEYKAVKEAIKANKAAGLMISEGGKGGSPGKDTSGWDKGWPPKPTPQPKPDPKLANFIAPGGSGKTLSEEAYWDGLQTIMETTEAGSNEQNKRLNILWHQFQDQVQKPQDGLKIAQNFSPADVPLGDGLINEAMTGAQKANKQKYDLMYQEGWTSREQYIKQMKRTFGKNYEQFLLD